MATETPGGGTPQPKTIKQFQKFYYAVVLKQQLENLGNMRVVLQEI